MKRKIGINDTSPMVGWSLSWGTCPVMVGQKMLRPGVLFILCYIYRSTRLSCSTPTLTPSNYRQLLLIHYQPRWHATEVVLVAWALWNPDSATNATNAITHRTGHQPPPSRSRYFKAHLFLICRSVAVWSISSCCRGEVEWSEWSYKSKDFLGWICIKQILHGIP